ncbi:MAG: DUF3870 domain-containing protein [Thermoleophilia bacterium]|nr:DUF3870 domain-containing protein [Thermoleophilia bacterium]
MAGNECVVCGYAKLPQATSAAQLYQMLTIVARVDKTTDVVQKASVSLVTPVAREFVEELLIGSNLVTGQEKFLEELTTNYAGGAQRAIRQAYRDLCERYLEIKRGGRFGPEGLPANE